MNDKDIWMKCVQHVIEKEAEYCILTAIDPIVIIPNSDSSSENSESEF